MFLKLLDPVIATVHEESIGLHVLLEVFCDLECVAVVNHNTRCYKVVVLENREVSNRPRMTCFNSCDSHSFSKKLMC